jgi:hypothetical protein
MTYLDRYMELSLLCSAAGLLLCVLFLWLLSRQK